MYILPVLGSLDIHRATKIGPKITKKIFFFVFCSVDPLNFSVTPKVTYYQKLEVQTLLLVKKKRKIFRGCFEIFWFFVWALSEPQRPPDAVFFGQDCIQNDRLICPNILMYDKPRFPLKKNHFLQFLHFRKLGSKNPLEGGMSLLDSPGGPKWLQKWNQRCYSITLHPIRGPRHIWAISKKFCQKVMSQ